jgi:hypothetical protein
MFDFGFVTIAGVTFACIPSKFRVDHGANQHREKDRDKGMGVIDSLARTAFKNFRVNPEVRVHPAIRCIGNLI